MKPALVIGNGPSVDLLDPKILDQYHTFGVNHIYAKFSNWGREVDNVVITDSNRIREIGRSYEKYLGRLYVGNEQYISLPYKRTKKILGRDFVPLRQITKGHMPEFWPFNKLRYSKYLYTTIFDKWKMGFDLMSGVNFGRSVVISGIQIAASLGHKEIRLTGVDCDYRIEKDYFNGMGSHVKYVNQTFTQNPRLFMEPMLVILQVYFEAMGVSLIDCTPNGKLKYINKGELAR